MISLRPAVMRNEGRGPIDRPSVPPNATHVLGVDLNRSESACPDSLHARPTEL